MTRYGIAIIEGDTMRDLAERVQYIVDYLSSYKTKIESLNKNGLFDTATLYELFAVEVCKLWFNQSFSNLNTIRSNYPYVDLISEDGSIYVQVSTGQNIPHKIKTTLESIRDSTDTRFSMINSLFFFVLENGSIDRVSDYTGEKRIGRIDFSRETNLISNDRIIYKAKYDLEFQKSLYVLLYNESKTFHVAVEKLDEMVHLSREIIQADIDGLINGEYEISRDGLISKIQSGNYQYISIIGDAGLGKSALCKKLVSNEEVILFARAEKFDEVTSIDDIWGVNVNEVLHYLNGKKIVFYIDALEFIADGKKTNIDLLRHLYEITHKYKNAYIITSCRTSDRNAFFRISSAYEIHEYPVPELTASEIAQVAIRYPVIKAMLQQSRYFQLLRAMHPKWC